MTPPARFPPDDPREWLRRARSNLSLARSRPHGVILEDLCFKVQQAAEKAVIKLAEAAVRWAEGRIEGGEPA